MKVSIVGTGYVGLVSGACLAEKGHDVTCVDVDRSKVDSINRGVPPIHEHGLEELLRRHVGKRLRATTELGPAIADTELTLVAAPTPFRQKSIDLTFVKEIARQIGAALRHKSDYHTVVVKSTVVPGTTDDVVGPALEETSGKRVGPGIGLGMNPEFLSEGEAINDFMFPDRIVLGGIDARTLDTLERLYVGFESIDRLRTSNRTAEMVKYASNALLATAISFSNEIGNLCAALGGIDVTDVMKGVHLSRYLSPVLENGRRVRAPIASFFEAGCGFGGSCLPKDLKALIAHGCRAGAKMSLLESVVEINADQPLRLVELVRTHLAPLKGRRVSVLGLAFKPGTDDMRESPAIPIVRELLWEGAVVRAYDPAAAREAAKVFADQPIVIAGTLAEALEGAEAVILVTSWEEFRALPAILARTASPPLVVDGRRMIDKSSVARYAAIGL